VYDIVFLSYHEPNAVEHWELVKNRFPRAVHVSGVKGIPQAHRAAAERCKTRYFWVIDADNIVDDDFNLTFNWPRSDEQKDRVAVWKARNNINGLEYGYGGIKLLPRRAVLAMPDSVVDFTTSISNFFHPMDEVASTTVINASPYEAWKAGFRECAKLASGAIKSNHPEEDGQRAEQWMAIANDVPNANHCTDGAKAGFQYGWDNDDDPKALAKINDWEWLHEQFENNS
jgi:hypothetical protein